MCLRMRGVSFRQHHTELTVYLGERRSKRGLGHHIVLQAPCSTVPYPVRRQATHVYMDKQSHDFGGVVHFSGVHRQSRWSILERVHLPFVSKSSGRRRSADNMDLRAGITCRE